MWKTTDARCIAVRRILSSDIMSWLLKHVYRDHINIGKRLFGFWSIRARNEADIIHVGNWSDILGLTCIQISTILSTQAKMQRPKIILDDHSLTDWLLEKVQYFFWSASIIFQLWRVLQSLHALLPDSLLLDYIIKTTFHSIQRFTNAPNNCTVVATRTGLEWNKNASKSGCYTTDNGANNDNDEKPMYNRGQMRFEMNFREIIRVWTLAYHYACTSRTPII